MTGRWLRIMVTMATAAVVLPGAGLAASAAAAPAVAYSTGECQAGAHTLAPPGSRMYPETGNGGYTSLHTLVHLVYDAATNMFLPGNQVVLTDQATQCLSSFSLDFERKSANTKAGPDMTVRSVAVNGQPAGFTFVQPTYPGDPHGQNDPNPAAHEASQHNPVGGPDHNPLPPACSPELPNTRTAADALDGTQCPANKLVITPAAPIANGSVFTVTVSYTGRPGVHNDGDGTTEGWFRAPDGGFVTTEPVGSEDWMPLNDYPAAKPTYDFSDTVSAGKTVLANGMLVSVKRNPVSAEFPGGSVTWNWHSPAPVASYLVEDSVGNFRLTERAADNGVKFYEAQDSAIPAQQRKKNLAIMNQQQNITEFESQFSGTYPFTSDGVVVGTPPASFEEEMQTMITFAGGFISTDVLYHENMHQWWGDNVTENNYTHDLLQGGHGHARRGAVRGPAGREQGRRPVLGQGPGRVPGQPGQAVQPDLRVQRLVLDGRAVQPRPVRPVLGPGHVRAAQRRLHSAAADPRPRQFHPGAGAGPAQLRRVIHHRGGVGGRVRPVAAGADQRLPGAAEPVLHAVVRHGLPGGRRRQPAADHRARPERAGLLQRPRRLLLAPPPQGGESSAQTILPGSPLPSGSTGAAASHSPAPGAGTRPGGAEAGSVAG